jgi:aldose 1-epimerase
MSYGGVIVSLLAPDREGRLANLVLGFETFEEYARQTSYFGAIVGRYANRIANARFTLDGKTYRLTANDGSNHLHGGRTGFNRVLWRPEPLESGLRLRYTSPDGEEGYPGTVHAEVIYTISAKNELRVDYAATTDQATPINLTQHSYFNLAGTGDVLGSVLQINADAITPVDDKLIPTGALASVAGTPFDFRKPMPIGARRGGKYDHNYVLNRTGPGLAHAARVVEPLSGRTLDVFTTEPGMQLYTGRVTAFCLETQHYSDSPNRDNFPSTILRPGEQYRSQTVFAFGVRRSS